MFYVNQPRSHEGMRKETGGLTHVALQKGPSVGAMRKEST